MVAPSRLDKLSVGDVTKVGSEEYSINSLLGQGSSGKAWLVSPRDGPEDDEFVLKVTTAKTSDHATQEANVFEVKTLEHLTENLSESQKDLGRVPLYQGHSISDAAKGTKCVACVMTLMEGKQLDKWLYGCEEQDRKSIELDTLINGRLPGGKLSTMRLHDATSVAISILTQLSPVLSTLHSSAYHRDISNHNILLCDVSRNPPVVKVSLIDFGLAVNIKKWVGGSWKTSMISGDARYWPPACWKSIANGFDSLEKRHIRQYKERLDHFSMGVLALEVLFALWNGRDDDGSSEELEPVHKAWCSVWKLLMESWRTLYYKPDASIGSKRQVCEKTANQLERNLQELRTALQNFSENFPYHSAAAFFNVCADLLDERGTLSWTDVLSDLQEGRSRFSSELTSYSSEVGEYHCFPSPPSPARNRNMRCTSDLTNASDARSRFSSELSMYSQITEREPTTPTCSLMPRGKRSCGNSQAACVVQ
jgi:serine/threonine protein kinase